jgi:hypothetical protein
MGKRLGVGVVGVLLACAGLSGCSSGPAGMAGAGGALPIPVPTVPGRGGGDGGGVRAVGGVSGPEFATAPGVAIDTRDHAPGDPGPWRGATRRPGEFVPAHERPVVAVGEESGLRAGVSGAEPRIVPGPSFPGIGQTEWVPPDPTIAVGPDHVVATVNMKIAFYDKAGNLQYVNWLSDSGSPGFFEPVGGSWFTFDPKCFYDHLAGRFVVVAPEVYGSDQAWICLGVSDDSDPNGLWYLYRTDAVLWAGDQSFWWDYPGFGYDGDAYYITANLFGLNQGGWGGVGLRVFKKAPLLSGGAAEYWTLRDGGSASAQFAHHSGPNQAAYFVSLGSTSRVRVHAVRDAVTNPTLVSVDVRIPVFRGPTGAPASGGNSVSLIDSRLFNAQWRDGHLFTGHSVSDFEGRNFARWYHLATRNWPATGAPELIESGEIDGGEGVHTYFPAVGVNGLGQVAMVHGMSSADTRISVAATGRNPGDSAGTMGAPVVLQEGPVDGGGRWGDYYGLTVDPSDDTTFWLVGEYPESFGWATWIDRFTVEAPVGPLARADDAGEVARGMGTRIDVTANDRHTLGQWFDVWFSDSHSQAGGAVTRSAGTGTGGRDELVYTPPPGYSGPDCLEYTVVDGVFRHSTATVFVRVSEVCAADFDGDGLVNTQDMLAFLNAWGAGDGRADVNSDGTLDVRDVLLFLNVWSAGC